LFQGTLPFVSDTMFPTMSNLCLLLSYHQSSHGNEAWLAYSYFGTEDDWKMCLWYGRQYSHPRIQPRFPCLHIVKQITNGNLMQGSNLGTHIGLPGHVTQIRCVLWYSCVLLRVYWAIKYSRACHAIVVGCVLLFVQYVHFFRTDWILRLSVQFPFFCFLFGIFHLMHTSFLFHSYFKQARTYVLMEAFLS
jgi:hypothetical protein